MKDYILERVNKIAEYVITYKCTVRQVANVFCVSKSTAHKDLSIRLPQVNKMLYQRVGVVLGQNWAERYVRGGNATKNKYKNKQKDC